MSNSLALALLSGCSVVERLVYKIDINQGNYVEQKSIDTLHVGMTKEQVSFVLGTPMLVEQSDPNTWYYVYYHKPGHNKPIQKNLIATFDTQNKLMSLTGDYPISDSFNTPIEQ